MNKNKLKYYKYLSSEWQRKCNCEKHEVRNCKHISNRNYSVLLISTLCSVFVDTINIVFGGKEGFIVCLFWGFFVCFVGLLLFCLFLHFFSFSKWNSELLVRT